MIKLKRGDKASIKPAKSFMDGLKSDFRMNYPLYLLMLPVIVYYIMFHYKPMYGAIIAFKDYQPAVGILESPWAGLKHFKSFFSNPDFFRILRKEFAVGLVAGLSLGGVAFLKVYLIDGLLLGNGEVGFRVTLAVSLATALTVVAAKIIGSSLPLLAKKIKLDPAVMASPFITTLVDAISLILYFFIALAILP